MEIKVGLELNASELIRLQNAIANSLSKVDYGSEEYLVMRSLWDALYKVGKEIR